VVDRDGSPIRSASGTKSANRSRVSSITTMLSATTTDAVRSSENCSLKPNPRPL
jgi:hypothetical protein